MSAKVIRCYRCRKRCRNIAGWNTEHIAGMLIGYLCPDCQTTGEDLEAELNMITGHTQSFKYKQYLDNTPDCAKSVVVGLINTYPTPQIMRDKANQLDAARKDDNAQVIVRTMRRVAEAMESGELYEDV